MNFENLERGDNEAKRKTSIETLKEDTKSHLDIPYFHEHIYMLIILTYKLL